MPPSTSSTEPLQKADSAETKKATAAATSAPVPTRPSGGRSQPDVSPGSTRPSTNVAMPGAVSPGQTTFTRTPCGPSFDGEHLPEPDEGALRDRVRADRDLGPDARRRRR